MIVYHPAHEQAKKARAVHAGQYGERFTDGLSGGWNNVLTLRTSGCYFGKRRTLLGTVSTLNLYFRMEHSRLQVASRPFPSGSMLSK